jgi:hypothetical protein
MKQTQEKQKENFYISRVFEGDKCLYAHNVPEFQVTDMVHLLTDVKVNMTGGLTFWFDVQIQKKEK